MIQNFPLWEKFLEEVTMRNEELQIYLQKLCGYCLIGKRNEQFIIFVVGPGANGKMYLSILYLMCLENMQELLVQDH